jgi:hypothetical protein
MAVITDEQFTEWLASPISVPVVLAILTHSDGVEYVGTYGYTSTPSDTPANTYFEDILLDQVKIVESIDKNTIGDFSLINDNTHTDWLDLNWLGFPVKIYLGDQRWSFSNFRLIVDGRNGGISAPATDKYKFDVLDPNEALRLEIGAENAPLCFGEVFNCRPPMIDAVNLRYKVNDGPISSIVVRDNGVVLTGGGVGYTLDAANGEFDLTASPAGQITCDVTQADNTAAQIITAITNLIPVADENSRVWDIADATGPVAYNATSTVAVAQNNAVITTPIESYEARVVNLDGAFGNHVTTPDSSSVDIVGELSIVGWASADDWAPSPDPKYLLAKDDASQRAYGLSIRAGGLLGLFVSANGVNLAFFESTVGTGFNDNDWHWIGATFDSAGDFRFYTSNDPGDTDFADISWSQLGDPVASGLTSIANTTSPLRIGTLRGALSGANREWSGEIGRAAVFASSDLGAGTAPSAEFNAKDYVSGSTLKSSTTGETYTLQGSAYINSASIPAAVKYLDLDGVSGSFASTPDANDLDVTTKFCVLGYMSLTDWTPASAQYLMCKWTNSGNQRSFGAGVNPDGTLILSVSDDGSTGSQNADSSVALPSTDGEGIWIAYVFDSGSVNFYYSQQSKSANYSTLSWTELGTQQTVSGGVTSAFIGTGVLEVGSFNAGNNGNADGEIYKAVLIDSNNLRGSAVADFDAGDYVSGSTLTSSGTGEVWTLSGGATIGEEPADGSQNIVQIESNTTPTDIASGEILITDLSTVNPSDGDKVFIKGKVKHVGVGGNWLIRASDLSANQDDIVSVATTEIDYKNFAHSFIYDSSAGGLDYVVFREDSGTNDGGIVIKDLELFVAGVAVNAQNLSLFPNTNSLGLYVEQPRQAGVLIREVMDTVGGSYRFNALSELEIFRLELPYAELYTEANAISQDDANATTGITASGAVMTVVTDPSSGGGTYALEVESNTTPTSAARAYIDLGSFFSGGEFLTIKIDAKHVGTGGDWRIVVADTDAGDSVFTQIGSLSNADTDYDEYTLSFTYSANTRYLVFMENNGANDGGVILDNLRIESSVALSPDDVFSIESSGIKSLGQEPPIRKMELGYQRNWNVQQADALAGSVGIQDREDFSREYRYAEKVNSLADFPLAKDKRLGTLFELEADAQTEVDRRQVIRSTKRGTFFVKSFLAPGQVKIGETIVIDYPDYGFDGGVPVRIIETQRFLGRGKIDLVVWK